MPLLPRSGAELSQPVAAAGSADQQTRDVETGTLLIAAGISFFGDIRTCKRLVVDGMVDVTLHRCEEFGIGDGGSFKGQARTENAEGSGRIEGELLVRKLLLIHTAGQVSGTTTYGQIEIAAGGSVINSSPRGGCVAEIALAPSFATTSRSFSGFALKIL